MVSPDSKGARGLRILSHFPFPLRRSLILSPDPIFIIGKHGLLFQTKLSENG